jgi:hypothetical protein
MREEELENRLKGARAEAPSALVDALGERAGVNRRSGRGARLAFAASLAVFMLGTFASFGGLSYAASGGTSAFRTIEKVATAHRVVVAHSSASSQYPKAATKPAKHVTRHKAPKQQVLGATTKGGTLPFTGISLLATVLLSLALMSIGLLLRRGERRNRA